MQTHFTKAQLEDPRLAEANAILRACVHCGMCTATCPSYQVLGSEPDSPRGRIYLIKEMLENGRPADAEITRHIDRCLSCLACMTTCPSGVNYMRLVDQARAHIEVTYRRPLRDRFLRAVLAGVLPYPRRFRLALLAARLAQPFAPLMPGARLKAMLRLLPKGPRAKAALPGGEVLPGGARRFPAEGVRRRRVALMPGCAQSVLAPGINEAATRLLQRAGCEVIWAQGAPCCGALTHHMGREGAAQASAAQMVAGLAALDAAAPLDAFVMTTSGCGTVVKDYGHLLAGHALAEKAAWLGGITRDISEVLADLAPLGVAPLRLRVAYHAACSLQHGQRVKEAPKALLRAAGFEVVEPRESHLCCGSAGTYNLLQPEIAGALQARKVKNLEALAPEVIVGGNLGCLMQIGAGTDLPVLHLAALLDWAGGGPCPAALAPVLARRGAAA